MAPRVAGDPRAAILVLAGTLIGSSLLWVGVTHVAAHLHTKISAESFMVRVNKFSGVLIWVFAIILLVDFSLHLK